MTLEDFFTLSEMKDGLTALSRVEELVNVMKKEKDTVDKNVGDPTRQWTAVASTIASTDSKECLDLFAQLDGLWFLNKWLEDGQKFDHNNSGSFLEETITALLQAIEKMQIDKEKSVSVGIWVTVQNLFHHSSSKIQEKARALFESWQQSTKCVPVCEYKNDHDGDMLNGKTAKESGKTDEVSISEKSSHTAETACANILQPRNSDNCLPETVEELQVNRENEVYSGKSDHEERHDRSPDPRLSASSDFTQENMVSKDGSHISIVQGTASTETHSSPSPKSAIVEGTPVATAQNDCPNDIKLVDRPAELPEKMSERDVSSTACALKSGSVSSNAPKGSVKKSDNFSVVSTALGDVGGHASMLNDREDNVGIKNLPGTKALLIDGQNDTLAASSSPTISNFVHISGKSEDQKSDLTRMEVDMPVKHKEHSRKKSSRKKLASASCFSKSAIGINPNVSDKKSEMEFDYGIADPLEIACNIAQEVEREVTDPREPSCSSSSDISSPDRVSQPDSPESIRVKSQHTTGFPSEINVVEGNSTEASSGDRCVINSMPDHVTNSGAIVKDQESLPVAVVAQEQDANPKRGACDFDLNQEVYSDDMQHPMNSVSPSIAFFSGTSAAPSKNDGPICQSSRVFDLNVVEGDEKYAGAYFVEKNSRKSERLNLDLNCISEDDDPAPSNLKIEGSCHQTALHSSTVSSSLQPTILRNIDLNDKPAFQNDFADKGSDIFGRPKSGDSVISIMGTKVEIPKRDLNSQSTSLPNGKTLDPQMDTNVTRTGGFLNMSPAVAYTHSPVFGYNGMVAGPTVSFSSPVGIPYLMDTRGSPVVPQFFGPRPIFPHPQQQFFMNMNSAPPRLTGPGPGPSQQSFDLNSGFVMDDNNKDAGGLRQFMPMQVSLTEEQLQPCSISGGGVKRKEPDSSWGTYPFNYKFQQPPWK